MTNLCLCHLQGTLCTAQATVCTDGAFQNKLVWMTPTNLARLAENTSDHEKEDDKEDKDEDESSASDGDQSADTEIETPEC